MKESRTLEDNRIKFLVGPVSYESKKSPPFLESFPVGPLMTVLIVRLVFRILRVRTRGRDCGEENPLSPENNRRYFMLEKIRYKILAQTSPERLV